LILVVAVLVLIALIVGAAAANTKRFEGYVGGTASGRGHHFVVGDGLNLVFVDRQRSHTAYRVCWHRLGHGYHRCWFAETGLAGHKERIFTAAPSRAGTYIVKWTVDRHRKAIWRFDNGVGD
jgi:hypothetical protein